MNQFVIIGRIQEISNQDAFSKVIVKVSRNNKNANGEYETDLLEVNVNGAIHQNIENYCNINDVIGIKGKIQNIKDSTMELIAEKVTFLSSSKANE